MATHRTTWKACERRAAKLFGTLRKPLSGSGGRKDQTRSDSVHPRLYIEVKMRERHPIRELYDVTREMARDETKTPILAIYDKNRPGMLLIFHSDDLDKIVDERMRAREQTDVVDR